jgi:hypothetical protein
MLDVDLTTGQRSQQINLGMVEEIVVLPLESWMGFLFNFEHDVSCKNSGHLVTLAAEFDLMAALDAAIDVNMQDLAFHDSLLAHAALASVSLTDGLSLTLAVGADCLEALDHRSHLSHHGLHTRTVATRAGFDRALLASAAFTLRADDRLLKS